MKIRSWHILAVFILLVPALEMYFLVHTGNLFGPFPTAIMVIASAATGAYFLRQQGSLTWQRLVDCFEQGRIPNREIFDGAFVMAGGLFLLSPGVFTDVVGMILILPWTRRRCIDTLNEKGWLTLEAPTEPDKANVIDGRFEQEDEE